MKRHIDFKGKALCGVRKRKRKLEFASDTEPTNCERCRRAASK